jgi:telomerase reverse transcriptase
MPLPYKHKSKAIGNDKDKARSGHSSCFFSQLKGIPQGSVLSALLCTFYFGYIEHKVFGINEQLYGHIDDCGKAKKDKMVDDPLGLISGQSTILRCMDDYLIISTESQYVQHFLSTVFSDSYAQFNVRVSLAKVKVNFSVRVDYQGQTLHLQPSTTSERLSWCGWWIDYSNYDLQIQPDFKRIIKLTSSITSVAQIRHLKGAVCNWIRMKCHTLVLDTSLNSLSSAMESVYHVYSVAAYRMAVSMDKLRVHNRGLAKLSEGYTLRCIRECILYGARLIHARTYSRTLLSEMSKTRLIYKRMRRMLQKSQQMDADDDQNNVNMVRSECAITFKKVKPFQCKRAGAV